MSKKLICAFFLFLMHGCMSIPHDIRNADLAKDFFQTHISLEEQSKVFETFTLEEQYDIFFYGNQVIHPPAMFLAVGLAKQGANIVPSLKKRLEIAQDELTIRDIALVFSEMARLKLYDFQKDSELMYLLDYRVSNMKGPWKKTTLDFISEIRSN